MGVDPRPAARRPTGFLATATPPAHSLAVAPHAPPDARVMPSPRSAPGDGAC
jgi:hypothetical protein